MKQLSRNRNVAVKKALDIALNICNSPSAIDRYLRGIDTEADEYHPANCSFAISKECLALPFSTDILDDRACIHKVLDGDYSEEAIEAFCNDIRTRAATVRQWFLDHPEVPLGQRNADKKILMHILDRAPAILADDDSDIWARRLAECHLLYSITEEEVDALMSKASGGYRYKSHDGSRL